MALGAHEMCLGDVVIAWAQRGYGPSVRGCSGGFGHKDGEVLVALGTAGTEWEGVIVTLGAAGIWWGHVRVALGTEGAEWEGMMVTLGTVGTPWGHMMVALGTEKAEQEGIMVVLATERTQCDGDFGTAGTQ